MWPAGHPPHKVVAGSSYLLQPLEVTGVAPGRPYNLLEDRNMGDIDPKRPVYAIRGHYTQYQCSPVNPTMSDPLMHSGTNCFAYDHPNAAGLCNVDSFGDWHCYMSDRNAPESRRYVPPPR